MMRRKEFKTYLSGGDAGERGGLGHRARRRRAREPPRSGREILASGGGESATGKEGINVFVVQVSHNGGRLACGGCGDQAEYDMENSHDGSD